MAAVDGTPSVAVGATRAEGPSGDEAGDSVAASHVEVADDAEQGGRPVALVEPAAEARIADEATPALARDAGAHEPRGVVWRDAEEDLLHELVHQRRAVSVWP